MLPRGLRLAQGFVIVSALALAIEHPPGHSSGADLLAPADRGGDEILTPPYQTVLEGLAPRLPTDSGEPLRLSGGEVLAAYQIEDGTLFVAIPERQMSIRLVIPEQVSSIQLSRTESQGQVPREAALIDQMQQKEEIPPAASGASIMGVPGESGELTAASAAISIQRTDDGKQVELRRGTGQIAKSLSGSDLPLERGETILEGKNVRGETGDAVKEGTVAAVQSSGDLSSGPRQELTIRRVGAVEETGAPERAEQSTIQEHEASSSKVATGAGALGGKTTTRDFVPETSVLGLSAPGRESTDLGGPAGASRPLDTATGSGNGMPAMGGKPWAPGMEFEIDDRHSPRGEGRASVSSSSDDLITATGAGPVGRGGARELEATSERVTRAVERRLLTSQIFVARGSGQTSGGAPMAFQWDSIAELMDFGGSRRAEGDLRRLFDASFASRVREGGWVTGVLDRGMAPRSRTRGVAVSARGLDRVRRTLEADRVSLMEIFDREAALGRVEIGSHGATVEARTTTEIAYFGHVVLVALSVTNKGERSLQGLRLLNGVPTNTQFVGFVGRPDDGFVQHYSERHRTLFWRLYVPLGPGETFQAVFALRLEPWYLGSAEPDGRDSAG